VRSWSDWCEHVPLPRGDYSWASGGWWSVVLSAALLASWSLAGCAGRGGPATEFVGGVVTLDGAPLENATVTFIPAESGGAVASGVTGADGRFSLTTASAGAVAGKGAPVGAYDVTVVKLPTVATPILDPNDPRYASQADLPVSPPTSKSLVPEAYGVRGSSGLKATVKKGTNEVTLSLDSKFKP